MRAAPRRYLADDAAAAVAAEGNKLKLNFFLPHDTIKSEAPVVRSLRISLP